MKKFLISLTMVVFCKHASITIDLIRGLAIAIDLIRGLAIAIDLIRGLAIAIGRVPVLGVAIRNDFFRIIPTKNTHRAP